MTHGPNGESQAATCSPDDWNGTDPTSSSVDRAVTPTSRAMAAASVDFPQRGPPATRVLCMSGCFAVFESIGQSELAGGEA